ncbi:hypothetical protein MK280_08285, partial [Myxococcota bacterium]|nr:hypothetical protein [Myxococcota bacterium]
QGYRALIEWLESEAVGGETVTPREMDSEWLRLEIEADFEPTGLLERLQAAAPLNLQIRSDGWQAEKGIHPEEGMGSSSGRGPTSDAGSLMEPQGPEILQIEATWKPLAEQPDRHQTSGPRR